MGLDYAVINTVGRAVAVGTTITSHIIATSATLHQHCECRNGNIAVCIIENSSSYGKSIYGDAGRGYDV